MIGYIGRVLFFWFLCFLGAMLSLFFITLPFGYLLVIFPVMYLLLCAAHLFGTMEQTGESLVIGSDGVVGYE
jgi:hypothetical protein